MFDLDRQHAFFQKNKTRSVRWRKEQLYTLLRVINEYEPVLYEAFYKDLHKCSFETFSTEIGIAKRCIRHILKNIDKWTKPKRRITPLLLFGKQSFTFYEPYGTVLIIGPFNYPFLTIIEPLAAAIAAGNTVFIKPSEQTPTISASLQDMLSSAFHSDFIEVITGDVENTQKLLELPFDLIFFTGSTRVGKIIMKKAAEHLTPLVLELGGKSPAIVCRDADIALAAKRIVWGRLLNAGQICIAPDYCLVYEPLKQKLIEEMKKEIRKMYGKNAALSKDYARIVSKRHAARLKSIIAAHKHEIVYGGNSKGLYVEPTLLLLTSTKGPAMQEEIFGPILPIIGFKHINEVFRITSSFSKPLALYIFGHNRNIVHRILRRVPSGGAMINDVILHVGNEYLPFGGVADSGMGRYHGRYSMEAFSHERSVMETKLHCTDFLLKAPYTKCKEYLIRRILH